MGITRHEDGTYQLSEAAKTPMSEEEVKKTHPGFTVTCDHCGSKQVIFENGVGYSAESGAWGSADLICLNCGRGVELIDT